MIPMIRLIITHANTFKTSNTTTIYEQLVKHHDSRKLSQIQISNLHIKVEQNDVIASHLTTLIYLIISLFFTDHNCPTTATLECFDTHSQNQFKKFFYSTVYPLTSSYHLLGGSNNGCSGLNRFTML